MRHIVAALVGAMIALAFVTVRFSYRIYNLERQMIRIEQEYQKVITQNEQLKRINDQNIRLLAEGGWDYDVFNSSPDN